MFIEFVEKKEELGLSIIVNACPRKIID